MPLRQSTPRGDRAAVAACAIALAVAIPVLRAQKPEPPTAAHVASSTLDRIRSTGQIRVGYRTDARPLSFRDESGQPSGYSVDLCGRMVETLRGHTGFTGLKAQWVPVAAENRFQLLEKREVDLLCGADTVTLSRRERVSFSIPIFPGGLGALVRSDSPARLREVLSGRGQTFRPVWRASASRVLEARAFTVVQGTTSVDWVAGRIRELEVIADVATAPDYETGIRSVLDRRADVLFGERAILFDLSRRHSGAQNLMVIDRQFTYEPIAIALGRDDEGLRLAVDRALSTIYRSGDFGGIFAKWFEEPDEGTLNFFRWTALPE